MANDEALVDFADQTTCHGLSQIRASKSRLRRILWIVSVITVVGFLSYQLFIRISEYTKFQTTTKVSQNHVKYIDFPAVTICNFNPLFNVSYEADESASVLARALKGHRPSSKDEGKLDYFNTTYNGSVREFMKEKGWQLGKSLRWCRFEETSCSVKNFRPAITNMGLCWSFTTDLTSIKPGSRGGLYFGVDIKEDDTFSESNSTSWLTGIRVQVHPSHEEPQVDELGLAISGGKIAFISVHKKEITLMPTPWGECDKRKENLLNFDTYTVVNCYEDCYREHLGEMCECILNDNASVPCTPETEVTCWADAVQTRNFANTYDCPCQPACESSHYEAMISSADLHFETTTQQTQPTDDDYYEYEFLEDYDYESLSGLMSVNVIGIHVYFDGMSVTKLEESEATTLSGFISDIGGQLGLWMGISVLTLIEVVQLLVDLSCGKRDKKVNPGKDSDAAG